MTGNLVALLHLCDSLFPLGSFAHSDGLEAATSAHQIETAADLRAWMDTTLTHALGRLEGPATRRAWNAFSSGNVTALAQVDDELYAMRPSSSGRSASRAMGARLLKTWQQIRPASNVDRVVRVRAAFTLPVAFGVVSAASMIPERQAVEGFLYTRLAATVSAAMRLMSLGQTEGHAALAATLARVSSMTDAILAQEEDAPLTCFTPAMDMAAMSQQYVHSRLFRS